jgi:hypothetical protein
MEADCGADPAVGGSPKSYIVAAQIGRYFGLVFGIFFGILTMIFVASTVSLLGEEVLNRTLNLDGSMRTIGLLTIMSLDGLLVFGAISAVLKRFTPG